MVHFHKLPHREQQRHIRELMRSVGRPPTTAYGGDTINAPGFERNRIRVQPISRGTRLVGGGEWEWDPDAEEFTAITVYPSARKRSDPPPPRMLTEREAREASSLLADFTGWPELTAPDRAAINRVRQALRTYLESSDVPPEPRR